jgi:hypothetical protein
VQPRVGHRGSACPQQIDLDPGDLGVQDLVPFGHETGPAARPANLVGRAEDLDDRDQGLRLHMNDLQEGFLDFFIHESWHDYRL